MTRAGIAAPAGKPNAGKSALLNRLVGQKLAITSPKPQTTRDRVVGILTRGDTQIIFHDTPGLLDPTYPLQRAMRAAAIEALRDADIIVHLVDAHDEQINPLHVEAGLRGPLDKPVILALNKVDSISKARRAELAAAFPDALMISALTGEGVDHLLDKIEEAMPESPFLYPEDDISTQSVRFFVAELVRETALEQLHEEVPYSVACEVEEYREGSDPVYIRAVLYVERESQKRIIIGRQGAQIRNIGRAAREKIEAFIGSPVYLDLWVKVLPNWRRDAAALRRLGYRLPEGEST